MHHPKKKLPGRIIIHARDVANITGQSERAGRWLIQQAREAAGKAPHQLVTIEDFCAYTGLTEDQVREYMML